MLFPVEDVTQYWPPRLAIFPWPPRPGSWTWMRVPPTRLMSGSATPRASTRSLIRSSALSITPLSVPLGACSTTERPPSRSRPRRGRVFVRKPATLAPTRRATTTRDAVSPRFLMPNVPSPIPALEESRSVDGELELAVQPLGSAPAHHHALQEDLEVLHDVADLGVDRKLQRYRSGSRVYPEKRLFGGIVDPVVDVEIDLGRLPDPASVHVRLVGEDHRCGDGADRLPTLLLVIAHGGHDQGNHEEEGGEAVSPISAAVILADKSDVHRSRVRKSAQIDFDIHDRVNYAAEQSFLRVDSAARTVTLELTIDTEISHVMEYF